MHDLIAHDIAGDADGLAVLLVHPLGADRRFWDSCRNRFGPGVRTIAVDLPGSGDTPLPADPLTLEDVVGHIEDLRRHLGVARMVLVGCAVGGMAAALYAARHRDRTAGLVVANPGIRIAEAASANLRQRAEAVRAGGMDAILPAAIENAFAGHYDTDGRHAYQARFRTQSPEGYALAVLGVCGADISGALGTIACPVLLVPGGRDLLMAPANADEIARLVPHAEIVPIPDGAHFMPYQTPEAFGSAVAHFLAEQSLVAPAISVDR